jgi:hypothetical protein
MGLIPRLAQFMSRRSLRFLATILVVAIEGCDETHEASLRARRESVKVSDATLSSPNDSSSPAETAAIDDYRNNNFYAEADIRHSFDTVRGDHVDCIDFGAQHSVKARLAAGLEMAPSPPSGVIPAAALAAHMVPSPGGNDGALDGNGQVRSCPAGTVMKSRPSVAEIMSFGGLEAYKVFARGRPRPQNTQNSVEHDCWNNDHALNYTTSHADICGTWDASVPGAGYCGNYDHATGIQTSDWLPEHFVIGGPPVYATGYYGASAITPVYQPTVDTLGAPSSYNDEQGVTQFWMQTGQCSNWWNGNNGADAGQQCQAGNACGSNCAVQSMELALTTVHIPGSGSVSQGKVFYTPDGYLSGCFSDQGDGFCPCYSSDGCPGGATQPYVEVTDGYYTPGVSLDANAYGDVPYELPIEVWNGTAAGLPYYYIFMFGQWIGWYPTSIFDWPYSGALTTSQGAGTAGPMVDGPATYLQAGGEVFQTWPYVVATNTSHHSQTSMGSDWPATSGYKYASYQRNVQYLDSTATATTLDGSALHDASLTLHTTSVPSYMLDHNSTFPSGVPGLCGYKAGGFTTENGVDMWYDTSTSAAAGGTGWGEYFYFGTVGLH